MRHRHAKATAMLLGCATACIITTGSQTAYGYQAPQTIHDISQRPPDATLGPNAIYQNNALVSTDYHTFVFYGYTGPDVGTYHVRWTAKSHTTGASTNGLVSTENPFRVQTDYPCTDFSLPNSNGRNAGLELNDECGNTHNTGNCQPNPGRLQACFGQLGEMHFMPRLDAIYKPGRAANETDTVATTSGVDVDYRSYDYVYVAIQLGRDEAGPHATEDTLYVFRAKYDPASTDLLREWERVPRNSYYSDPNLEETNCCAEFGQNYMVLGMPYWGWGGGHGRYVHNYGLCRHDLGRGKVFVTYQVTEHNHTGPWPSTIYNTCLEATGANNGESTIDIGNGTAFRLPDNTVFVDAAYSEKMLVQSSSSYKKFCTTAILYTAQLGVYPSYDTGLKLRVITNTYTSSGGGNWVWSYAGQTWNDFDVISANPGPGEDHYYGATDSTIEIAEEDSDTLTNCPRMCQFYVNYHIATWGYDQNRGAVLRITRDANGSIQSGLTKTLAPFTWGHPGQRSSVASVQEGAVYASHQRLFYLHGTDPAKNILNTDSNQFAASPRGDSSFGIPVASPEPLAYNVWLSRIPFVVRYLGSGQNAAWTNARLTNRFYCVWADSSSPSPGLKGRVSEPLPFRDTKFNSSVLLQSANHTQMWNPDMSTDYSQRAPANNPAYTRWVDGGEPMLGDRQLIAMTFPLAPFGQEDQVYSSKLILDNQSHANLNEYEFHGVRLQWRQGALPAYGILDGARYIARVLGDEDHSSGDPFTKTVEIGYCHDVNTPLEYFHDEPLFNNGWYFLRVDGPEFGSGIDAWAWIYNTEKLRLNYIDWDGNYTWNPVPGGPPTNDDCATAANQSCGAVIVGPLTLGATAGTNPPPGCSTLPDVWYKIPAASGHACGWGVNAIYLDNSTGSGYVAIYTGSCGNLVLRSYNCNRSFLGTGALAAYYCIETATAEDVYVRIGSNSISPNQRLEISCFDKTSPAQWSCP